MPPPSLTGFLRRRSAERADAPAYVFLAEGEIEAERLSWRRLDARAQAVAAALRDSSRSGERALLLFPPGLDFVAAFFGCLYAGIVAVPAYPPRPRRDDPRLRGIARDAAPSVVLTTAGQLAGIERVVERAPELASARWLAVDALPEDGSWDGPEPRPEDLAFLQYTSGSTAAPKGVMVTHANLLHNEHMIQRAFGQSQESVVVGWLPLYHDMGLIGNVLQPLWSGGTCVLMSPAAFLQQPVRWLRAISRYRATTSGGPNFAYELCVRKVPPAEREGLDLSSWRVAFNGAEPVRAETLERFAEAFADCGFRKEAFYPCYGLAEATLFVTGGAAGRGARVEFFSAASLERHAPQGALPGEGARALVACGRPWSGQRVAIVDPETGAECRPGRVGEIWVSGPSVALGYWGQPEETARTFDATLAGGGRRRYLRTGDLGFFADGELFVTGRLKDLIILRGRNHYPQDLERTAERSHDVLRPGGGAAFSIDVEGEERLVLVQELERHPQADVEAVAAAIRRAVAEQHEVQVHEVVLVRAGTVPKTSSGKVRRHACRSLYLAGALAAAGRSRLAGPAGARPGTRLGLTAQAERMSPPEGLTESGGKARSLRQVLVDTPEAERLPLVEDFLRQSFARLARVEPWRLDADQPLSAFGLDSLVAVELKGALESELDVSPSIAALLEASSLREAARQVLALAERGPEPVFQPAAGSTAGAEHPLSWGQRSLWFLHRLAPESAAYNMPGAAWLPEGVDAEALRRAFQALVDRHAALRTTYGDSPAGPVQRVSERVELAFTREDASAWSDGELRRRLDEEAFRPFDLGRGPVLRVALFERQGAPGLLVLTLHHIVADLWSLAVLVRELGVLYTRLVSGAAAELPPLDLQYPDYARWQERMLAGPEGERLWRYWSARLAGAPPLEVPADRPRPVVQTYEGASRAIRLGAELSERAREVARGHGATLFMFLLAGFQALLARTSGQENFLVGCPTSGRAPARVGERLTRLVGYFVNPVALRADLAGDPSAAEWLGRVRRTALDAFEHQDFPLALLAERLRPDRGSGGPPLVQAMFVLQKAPAPEVEALAAFALGEGGARLSLGGLHLESASLPSRFAQFDLTLVAAELQGEIAASLQWSRELFDDATAERMLCHLANLLRAMAAEPARRISELELLSPAEVRQIAAWNETRVERPQGLCLHQLFEAQVDETPDRVAVDGAGEQWSYQALNRRANRLAHHLRRLGIGPEVRVGLLLERSPEMVASVLAVLKAGGAYVPLDPAYPADRLAFTVEDAQVEALLTRERPIGAPLPAARRVCLDSEREAIDRCRAENPEPVAVPGNLAYVLYTSGSTGRPKGVAVEHRSPVELVCWARDAFSGEELAGVLASTSLCFDLSVFELFGPLSWGGTVVLAGDALALPELAAAGRVTLINTVPSAMAEIAEGALPPGLRIVNLAGEPLRAQLAGRIYGHAQVRRVLDLYGPSEDTTYSTWAEVERGVERVTIGGPLPNTRAYLLDRRLQSVPVGVPAELCLAGAGLARGYLGRPALTAERFVPDPFGGPGERLYRTGDRVRRLPDGQLDFLGRLDYQVKVRGFRIELGEVEAALAGHPELREAVVVARDDLPGGRGLVAYMVPQREPAPAAAELRRFLRTKLPEPMVPAFFVSLPELPRTLTGKVDRKALPRPEAGRSGGAFTAPRTPVEELVAGLWAELLGLDLVGLDDNFFDLGGHSLLAIQFVSRLHRAFGVDLSLRQLFRDPTVGGLAAAVEAERAAGRGLDLPPIQPLPRQQRQRPLPLSFAQERLWFLDRLAPGLPVYNLPYGLRLRGELCLPALAGALEEIVGRHEALRTAFPAAGDDSLPVQVVLPARSFVLAQVDLAALPEWRREQEAMRLAGAAARRPFDLAGGRPVRALLLRLAAEHHLLLLVLHHIVTDGWSLEVLRRELAALYSAWVEGRPSPLPELPLQYADYAVWQRQWLDGERLESRLAWWRQHLAGAPAALELPYDRPRPAVQAFRGAAEPFRLPPDLVRELRGVARRQGVTLFMALLAGFAALLQRYGAGEDLVIGTAVANRSRPEVEPLIGLFVNTLPLRLPLGGDPPLGEVLGRVREAALGAYAHQDVPFERLVEDLAPRRDLSRSPLFQVLLVVQESLAPAPDLPGLELAQVPLHTGTAKFDLTLSLAEADGALAGGLEFDADLFEAVTAQRLLSHLTDLLAGIAHGDGSRLSDLRLSGEVPIETAQARHSGALAAAVMAREQEREIVLPRDPVEEAVAEVWCDLLGRERVSVHEDFFEVGGHSLLAARLASRLYRTLGVELPLRQVFQAPTVARLAEVVREARRGGQGSPAPPIVPVPRPASGGPAGLPLSFSQMREWLLDRLEPGTPAYNVAQAVRLRGPLDGAALWHAFDEIVRRHEALRTTFPAVAGQPIQVIAPALELSKPIIDLAELPPGRRQAEARRLAEEDALFSFDLARGPLLKVTLLRLGAEEHALLLNTHHIVSDLWSIGVLLRELSALYGAAAVGREPALPPLPVQYADYAIWQRERLQGEVLESLLAFWRDRLAAAPPPLALPADRPRPAVQSFRGAEVPVRLGPELSAAIAGLARRAGASLFMTLLAAFKALVHRLAGEEDLAVGTFVANRTRAEVEPLIGFFVNTLVLRTAPSAPLPFRSYLEGVREVALDAFAHQELPFEKLLEELQPERSLAHTPLFQVMFVFQNTPGLDSRLAGLELERLEVETRRSNFDLTLWLWEGQTGLEGSLHYATDLFDRGTARRWAGHFRTLLAGAAAGSERSLGELPLLSEAEREQLLRRWSRTPGSVRRERRDARIHELFAEQVERTPDAPALACAEQAVTYAELKARARRLAQTLARLGVGPEVRVGLCAERTPELVVGMLAVLEAGGAFVPLDAAYPRERLAFLLEDSGAAVVLTQERLESALPAGVPVLLLDRVEPVGAAPLLTSPLPQPSPAQGGGTKTGAPVEGREGRGSAGPAQRLAAPQGAHTKERSGLHPPHGGRARFPAGAMAWLIYTSGSTGRPKGVAVSHANAVPLLVWSVEYFGLRPGTRVLQSLSYAFDFGVFEVLSTLLAGGTLHLPGSDFGDPRRWAKAALAHGVDTVHATPSFFREVAASGVQLPGVRLLHLGGEALSRGLAERLLRAVGKDCVLYNGYGPTEATVNSLIYAARPPAAWPAGEAVPIGRPSAENAAYVLDRAGEPVPPGIPGELYLGGPGVARGYHGRPELTAERFVPDPFGGGPGGRLYRSGDRVRWLPSGDVEFLGRTDHQVKVRGFRIELGEIEAALARHPAVREAVVAAREDAPGDRRLAAYFVSAGGEAPQAGELREFLAASLPGYMVPSAFVPLAAFPVTPSGKLDRRALPAPEGGAGLAGHVAPRTPAEEILAGIWAEVLGVERVGVEDNFFALGGHSLLATQIAARVQDAFGVGVPLRALFEGPTVAELAARVEAGGESEMPPLRRVPRDRDLPLSFPQERIWFLAQLDPTSAAYHVPRSVWITGRLDVQALAWAYGALLERHEILRTTFPDAGGRPVQRIYPAAPPEAFVLPVIDLRGLPPAPCRVRERELERLVLDDGVRLFDLAQGPLLRASVARLEDERSVVIQTEHHLVHDGWAEAVLLGDLLELYAARTQARPSRLPELPVQFADFACWQREWLRGEALERQVAYWRGRLAGAPPLLELPTDRPRPPVLSARGGAHNSAAPARRVRDLTALGRRHGVTLFMAMMAAWQALLCRWSGREDMVVGTWIANRRRRELEGLLGMVINTVVLRTDLSGDPGLGDLLRRMRETCLGAFAHQDVPFDRVVEALHPERSLSHAPVVQVVFSFHDARFPAVDLPGLSIRPNELHNRSSKFDLTLILRPLPDHVPAGDGMEPGAVLVHAEYSTDLFDATTVARLMGHYHVLLAGMLAGQEPRLSELPLLSEPEKAQLLREWNDTANVLSVLDVLDVLSVLEPASDAVALVFEDQLLSYGELCRWVERLARHLIAAGVGPETRVGLCAERSPALVVGLLAVLRAGGAYLPLDPAYPKERLAFMLADAGVGLVLADRASLGRLPGPEEAPNLGIVRLDQPALQAGRGASLRLPRPLPGQLAYVLYTSGSTGRPKGVGVPHGALVNFLESMRRVPGFAPGQALLAVTPISFDIAGLELYLPLLAGGRIELASRQETADGALLAARLARSQAAVLQATPATWRMLLDAGWTGDRHLSALCGGEALPPDLAAELADRVGELWNLYGPTETTIWSAVARIARNAGGEVALGRPIANTRIHLLDQALQPVPAGAHGELCIGGEGLARGYLGRPALTAERFVPDPCGPQPGERLYRTGDLARRLPDGRLDFLGRLDHQVKVRGFRIELGEIEAALAARPEVAQAVVLAREERPGDRRLVAYVVPAGGAGTAFSVAELRDGLRQRLPEHMVPSGWVVLEAMPLTPNGKVDRRALARLAPEPGTAAGGDRPAPRTPVEEVLAGIWEEVLGVERLPRPVGAGDHFFDLGGHSLLGTRVVSRVREALGVEVPLRALFEAPTLAEFARRIELARLEAALPAPPLVPVPREGDLPLSFAQQRLWFLDRLEPDSPLYLLHGAVRLTGALDVEALRRACREVVRRHESLRTCFPAVAGRPVQRIAAAAPVPVPLVDLAGLSGPASGAQSDELRRISRAEGRRPFDLERSPLLRACLVRLGAGEHVLLLNVHHIAADGWSMGILQRELAGLYGAFAAGSPSPLPDLPVQYADFAVWQRRWLQGEALEAQLAYWRQQLGDSPEPLALPFDHPRPALGTFRGGVEPLALGAPLARDLAALSRRRGATLSMTLLAGFKSLLSRLARREDVAVGLAIANRNRREVEPLIGVFVNTLVLRSRVGRHAGFAALVDRVRETALEAYAHQDLPFEKLVEELQPERHLGRNPLVQVMFGFQNFPGAELKVQGLTLSALDDAAMDTGTSKFDLTLFLVERGASLEGIFEYNRDLFDPSTVRRLAGQFEILLRAAAAGPDRPLAQLPLLSAPERHQLLHEWNATAADYPQAGLAALFEEQVRRAPDAAALVCGDAVVTYGALNRRANRLAHRLRHLGVGLESRAGLCLERSPELIVAVLAILKAGGAYVPLDPDYPRERLAFMVDDAGLEVLIAETAAAAHLPQAAVETLLLDREPLASWPAGDPPAAADGDGLAYAMYTSGSTGRPKGVEITQRAVARLVSNTGYAGFSSAEVFLQLAPVSFDASTLEIWGALLHGAKLVLAPPGALALDELGSEIERHGVTTLWLTAALFHQMVEHRLERLRPVRQLLAGGDVLSPRHVQQTLSRFPGVRLINGYGPTENTTFTCCHPMADPDQAGDPVPLGRPIANTRVRLLDAAGEPVPIGVAGELCAAGDGLARGYLDRPELTAERFVPDPFGAPGERLYRTGDLARHLPDGGIEFLRRIDDQVKLRGFRVEPGEVEAALRAEPGVKDAVVVVSGSPGAEDADRRLIAFVVGEGRLDGGALRRGLGRKLPAYMVPSTCVVLADLPLTPSGKVDRRALAALEPASGRMAQDLSGVVAPPRSRIEEVLAEVWSEALRVDRVDLQDDFFGLGGHSLLATQVLSRLRQLFQVDLSLRQLFEHSTVAALAAHLQQKLQQARGLRVPPLAPAEPKTDVPLSFSQQRLWFLDQLQPGGTAYVLFRVLELSGPLDVGTLQRALNGVVRRQASLRTRFEFRDGAPVQVVEPPRPVELPLVDLRALDGACRERESRRLVAAEGRTPFDLARGPIFRCRLLALAEQRHLLTVALHHIVGDGWSLDLLARELALLYGGCLRGDVSPLAELPVQYTDFALWQQRWLQGEALEAELAYWRKRLAGAPAVLALPADRPRPEVASLRGARHGFEISEELSRRLRALSREEGCTLFMTLLASFQTLLYAYSGEEDVVVGSPISSRNWPEIREVIGFFSNTLLFRTDLSGDPTFRQLLARVRDVALGAFEHEHVPFEKLVQELRPERSLAYNPLFQVAFAFQPAAVEKLEAPGLSIRPVQFEVEATPFDLVLSVVGTSSLAGAFQYSCDLFQETTIAWLEEQFRQLLQQVAADPEVRIGRLRSSLEDAARRRRQEAQSEIKRASAESFQRRRRQPVGVSRP